jgi:hypothetical protein
MTQLCRQQHIAGLWLHLCGTTAAAAAAATAAAVFAHLTAQAHNGHPISPATANQPAGLLNLPPAMTDETQPGAPAKNDVFHSAPDT